MRGDFNSVKDQKACGIFVEKQCRRVGEPMLRLSVLRTAAICVALNVRTTRFEVE